MNKFKFVILLVIMFILSGCNGSYNLYIDNNYFSEDIKIDTLNLSSDIINRNYYPFNYDLTKVYERKNIKDNGISILNLRYKYSFEEFLNSTAYITCFLNRKYENNKDYYYIYLNDLVECYYGQDFDINIITKNKVLMNNADSVNGNTYTWHVTEKNKDNLTIEIKIAKGKLANDYSYITYILFGIIVLGVIIVIRKFMNKKEIRNEF